MHRDGCRGCVPLVKLGGQMVDDARRRVQHAIHGHAVDAEDPHPKVLIAWRCAQQLSAVHHQPDAAAGRHLAEQVLASFPSCPIPEVARLGRTMKRWQGPFLAHFDTAGTTSPFIWTADQTIDKVNRKRK